MTDEKQKCSKGWSDRCARSKSKKCSCACGGENHGKKRPVSEYNKGDALKVEELSTARAIPGYLVGDWITRNVFWGLNKLDPKPSQKIANHSPNGFCWGYGGSGPAQLALAICLYVSGDEKVSFNIYQEFKSDFVAKLPQKDFEIPLQPMLDRLGKLIHREYKRLGIIKTVHDGDCPKCGFPETVITRDAKTMKALKVECSKNCGYRKSYNGK